MREEDKHIPWDKITDHIRSNRKDIDPELMDWLDEKNENQELFEEIVEVHQLTRNVPEPFVPDSGIAWSKIEERVRPVNSIKRFISVFSKVAAAILILALGFSLALVLRSRDQGQLTRVYAPKGQKTQIFLPDSSIVFLNGGTNLTYASDFLDNRKIELAGEALFVVRNKTKSQFTVQTDFIDVNVFGTQFNVKAYSEDPEIEIALLEGSIGLAKNNKDLLDLSPGHIAVLNKETQKIDVQRGDVSKIISWSHDELIFEDKTFEEIITYLERWYGVEIQLDKALKGKHRFTFNVKTESLRELLKLINVITPIEYDIDGKHVKISKRK